MAGAIRFSVSKVAAWTARRSELASQAREWMSNFATASIGEEMLRLIAEIDAAIKTDAERAVVLASHLGAAQKAAQVGQWLLYDMPIVAQESKRRECHKRNAAHQHANRNNRIALARDLFSEYAQDERHGRLKAVHKEIGEIMAQRLGLAKPIKSSTVRSYLAKTAKD
jgi:hypothetical protein